MECSYKLLVIALKQALDGTGCKNKNNLMHLALKYLPFWYVLRHLWPTGLLGNHSSLQNTTLTGLTVSSQEG